MQRQVGPCKFKANLIDKVNSRPTQSTQVKCLENKKTTTKNPTNKQKQVRIYKNLKIIKKYSLLNFCFDPFLDYIQFELYSLKVK